MKSEKILIGIIKNLNSALININNLEDDFSEYLDKYTLHYSITCILKNIEEVIKTTNKTK